MKKKKVLLALLASACIVASATAFAACEETGDVRDPALYAAYQTYAEGNDDAMTYEEWVADILDKLEKGGPEGPEGPAGVGVVDVTLVEEGGVKYIRFVYSDGTHTDLPMSGLNN